MDKIKLIEKEFKYSIGDYIILRKSYVIDSKSPVNICQVFKIMIEHDVVTYHCVEIKNIDTDLNVVYNNHPYRIFHKIAEDDPTILDKSEELYESVKMSYKKHLNRESKELNKTLDIIFK